VRDSGFGQGCAVGAVVLDVVATSDPLQRRCGETFAGWEEALRSILERDGISPERSARLAAMVVVTLEGGLLIARAQRRSEPLEEAGAEVAELIRLATPRRRQLKKPAK
jgi:transcriptional regulator LmrA/YxaF-like protein